MRGSNVAPSFASSSCFISLVLPMPKIPETVSHPLNAWIARISLMSVQELSLTMWISLRFSSLKDGTYEPCTDTGLLDVSGYELDVVGWPLGQYHHPTANRLSSESLCKCRLSNHHVGISSLSNNFYPTVVQSVSQETD